MNSEFGEDLRTLQDNYLGKTKEGRMQAQNLYQNIDNVLNCPLERPFQSKVFSTSILARCFGY